MTANHGARTNFGGAVVRFRELLGATLAIRFRLLDVIAGNCVVFPSGCDEPRFPVCGDIWLACGSEGGLDGGTLEGIGDVGLSWRMPT